MPISNPRDRSMRSRSKRRQLGRGQASVPIFVLILSYVNRLQSDGIMENHSEPGYPSAESQPDRERDKPGASLRMWNGTRSNHGFAKCGKESRPLLPSQRRTGISGARSNRLTWGYVGIAGLPE